MRHFWRTIATANASLATNPRSNSVEEPRKTAADAHVLARDIRDRRFNGLRGARPSPERTGLRVANPCITAILQGFLKNVGEFADITLV
jgi:hypothetical protein